MPPSISRTPDFSNQFSFPFEILAESLSLIRWWFCWRARARENERRSHEERAAKPRRASGEARQEVSHCLLPIPLPKFCEIFVCARTPQRNADERASDTVPFSVRASNHESKSLQAYSSAVGRLERLWDNNNF